MGQKQPTDFSYLGFHLAIIALITNSAFHLAITHYYKELQNCQKAN
jgi:hypothetical protein